MPKGKINIDFENLEDFFLSGFFQEYKKDIAKYISEKEGINYTSAVRNLNRMYNYYAGTGKQSRSGKNYIPYIQEFLEQKQAAMQTTGKQFVGIFPSEYDALLYIGDLTVLEITYNKNMEVEVWRKLQS
jgi:hypothetical protein